MAMKPVCFFFFLNIQMEMYLMSTHSVCEWKNALRVCVRAWSSVTSNLRLLEQAGVELCTCSQWAFEQMCLHKVESVVEISVCSISIREDSAGP